MTDTQLATRQQAITKAKAELAQNIGTAQSILLLQKTPKGEIRHRPGPGGRQLAYIEHAYVTETLNWAFGMKWNLIVTAREKLSNECIVHGYLEVPIGDMMVRKDGTGSAITLPNVPIGDIYKSATSDLLKVCAARLGLGLDLYRHDESLIQAPPSPAKTAQSVVYGETQQGGNDYMFKPATAQQLKVLADLGVEIPDKCTFEQAAKLIRENKQTK